MNIGVIFAGGVGSRMRSKEKPKQFLELHGKPIIVQTIQVFEDHPQIDAVVVACLDTWIPYLESILEKFGIWKVRRIVPGGNSGPESIYNALCAAEELAGDEKSIVLIHDGVRPLISERTLTDNIESVMEYGSAVTCVSVNETVLRVDEQGQVCAIPNRNECRLARAPQSFWLDEIIAMYRRAIAEDRLRYVDSCSMMFAYGKKLHLVEGGNENLKVTTPEDFYIMRAILDAKENAQIYGLDEE